MIAPQPVNFKEVFGTQIHECTVNPYWTVREFIENVRPILSELFGINQRDLEIIVPEEDLQGMPAEMGPELTESDIVLANTWGRKLEYVSCYVRRKNYVYRQIENLMRRQQENQDQARECPVCYGEQELVTRYVCRHSICLSCYDMCCNAGHMTCPMCRSESVDAINNV